MNVCDKNIDSTKIMWTSIDSTLIVVTDLILYFLIFLVIVFEIIASDGE